MANVIVEEENVKHMIACFKAGRSGQPMPAKADKSNGKVIGIASGVGAVVALGTFGLGIVVGRKTGGEKLENA